MARNPFSTRAKPNQMLKSERFKLAKLLARAVESIDGADKLFDLAYHWTIPTDAGRLSIAYEVDYGTIFTRFEEPARAALVVDCNPHSGKWNFHHGRVTAQEALDSFLLQLSAVRRPEAAAAERTGDRRPADLTRNELVDLVSEIVETLYPAADPDAEWEADTIEWVSAALDRFGLIPAACFPAKPD
jgi:hypothetical protein